MKLHYYPETDSFYIELKAIAGATTREIPEGAEADLDAFVIGFRCGLAMSADVAAAF